MLKLTKASARLINHHKSFVQPFDTLIADITNDVNHVVVEPVNMEDIEEWWGLQYTLELSRRDSRASDSSSNHTGEHSKVIVTSSLV